MKRGRSSVRESNQKCFGSISPEERCVTSSNLVVPTHLDIKNVTFSYNDRNRKIHLPTILNELLSEDVGIQIGDGSLPIFTDKKGVQHHVIGCYGNIEEDQEYLRNFVIPLKKKLFNIEPNLKTHLVASECYIKFESKAIVNFYKNVLRLQVGKKNNISIPEIILNAPLGIKLACIRGIADTDFSLVFKKDFKGIHRDPYIQLGCSSKNLVTQIAQILKDIEIDSTKVMNSKSKLKGRDKIYVKHYLFIHGKKNLEKWMKFIGFHNPVQITKYLVWKKFGFCPPKTTLKQRNEILKDRLNIKTFGY